MRAEQVGSRLSGRPEGPWEGGPTHHPRKGAQVGSTYLLRGP